MVLCIFVWIKYFVILKGEWVSSAAIRRMAKGWGTAEWKRGGGADGSHHKCPARK